MPENNKQFIPNSDFDITRERKLDRLDVLQRQKDREGGEHLEMMINQTRTKAQKAQKAQKALKSKRANITFMEDVDNVMEKEGVFVESSQPQKEDFFVKDEPEEVQNDHVSMIKIDMNDSFGAKMKKSQDDFSKKLTNKNEIGIKGPLLGKRNDKKFEEGNNLDAMFDSGDEGEKMSTMGNNFSGQGNQDFLKNQREKKHREKLITERETEELMVKKVQSGLKKENLKEEDRQLSDVEKEDDEDLNSDDDISGKNT